MATTQPLSSSSRTLGLRDEFAGNRNAVHDAMFALALYLLPFSLGEEIVVVTFALPVLFILSIYYVSRFVREDARVDRSVRAIVVLSAASVLVMTATSFLAESPLRSLWRVAMHASGFLILVYFSSSLCEASLERFQRLSRILVISGAIMALYYILNFVFAAIDNGLETVYMERGVGGLAALPWGASNTVAAILIMPLALALLGLGTESAAARTMIERERQRGARALMLASAIIIIGGVLITFSRNGIAVMIFIMACFFMRRARLGVVLTAALVGFVAYLFSVDQGVAGYIFEQRLDSHELETFNLRVDIWSAFTNYFLANPFEPIGYYESLFRFGYTGHNFSLTTLVEQSIVGWLAAVALFIALLKQAWNISRSPAPTNVFHGRFLFLSLIAIGINLHFEDANFTHQYILYFWTFMGLVALRTRIARRSKTA